MKTLRNYVLLTTLSCVFATQSATAATWPAHGVSAANVKVVQKDTGNTTNSVTTTTTTSINGMRIRDGSNRGDVILQVGSTAADDQVNGVLIASVAENGRNNGEPTGTNYCTASAVATYVATASTTNGAEYNVNVSVASFPYAKFLGGYARNSAGTAGGPNDTLTSSPGLLWGTHFVDNGGGVSTVNLTSFGINSQTDGVLLVAGAENNNKYASSWADTNGTWKIYSRSNNADGTSSHQGAVAFVFIPKTNTTVISGRFADNGAILNHDGATPRFNVAKTTNGVWRLGIPGRSSTNGVLIISPEGTGLNFDNVMSAQPSGTNWIIQSRDLPLCGLQAQSASLGVASFVFIPTPDEYVWSGGGTNDNWSLEENWDGAAPTSGNELVFNGAARLVNTNNLSSLSTPALVFKSSEFSLYGNGLTVTKGVTNSTGTNVINAGLTFGGAVRLQADAGMLTVGVVSGGANALTVDGAGNVTVGGVISGTGSVTKNGAGILTLSGPAANTSSGATILNAGTLALAKSAGVNALAGNVTVGDGTGGAGADVVRLDAANQISDTAVVTVSASGLFDLNNVSETIGSIVGTNSAAQIALGSGTLTAGNGSAATFAGIISGTGNLVKQGSGPLTLSGVNTFEGTLTINAGVVNPQNAAAFGGAGATVVSSGAAVELQGGFTFSESLTLNGTGLASGGALRNVSGDNFWNGSVTLAGASSINSDSGNLTIGGDVGGGQSLTVSGNGSNTISGAITSGSLTKNGTGTLTLNGTNIYTGNTIINAGTLALGEEASISGTPVITLANDATFDISISGFFLQTNQTMVRNASSGVGNVLGDLFLDFGAQVSLQMDGVGKTVGVIAVSGDILASSNTLTINVNGAPLGAGTYPLITCTGEQSGSFDPIPVITGAGIAAGYLVEILNPGEEGDGQISLRVYSTSVNWTGGGTDNNWSTGANWDGVAPNTGDRLRFNGATRPANVNNIDDLSVSSVHFNNGGFSVSGNDLTVVSALTNSAGNNVISAGVVLGGDLLIQADAGTLTLGNVFGDVNMLVLDGAGNVTVNGVFSGDSAVIKDGAGTLQFSGTNANTSLSDMVVYAGTLLLAKSAGVDAVGGNITVGDGVGGAGADVVRLNAAHQIVDGVDVMVSASGLFDLNNASETVSALSGESGGQITLGSGTLTVGDATEATFAGVISGSGHLVKQDIGKLTLSGANTFTGNTTISAGTLALDAGGDLVSSNITLANDTLFDVTTTGFTLGAGKTMARNAATGEATINGNVTLAAGAKISLQGNGGFGVLVMNGDLTLNTNIITLNLSGTPLAAGTYTLIHYTGTKTGAFHAMPVITGVGLGEGLEGRIVETDENISLQVYLVPMVVAAANVKVVQKDPGATTNSVTTTTTLSINGMRIRDGSTRGDVILQVGPTATNDVDNGVLLGSVAENGRNNGEATGTNFCTASTRGSYVATSTTTNGGEYNINVSVASFPYANFLGGYARNSVGTPGATNDLLTASPGLVKGTHFVDHGGGVFTVNLTSLGINSQTDGVLLVNGGENNNKYANSLVDTNGTWKVYTRSNNADGTASHHGAVAFVFIPKTNTSVISGRFADNGAILNHDGMTPRFNVAKTTNGVWRLGIPGRSSTNGVLIISSEGSGLNFDNVMSAQPSGTNWIIQSRDLPNCGLQAQSPGIGVASFVFIPRPTVYSWSGGGTNNNWSTGDNWDGSAPMSGDKLIFGGVMRMINTNNLSALVIPSLTLENGDFSLYGNALTISNTLINMEGTNALYAPLTLGGAGRIQSDAGIVTLAGAITGGTNRLTVDGAGNVTASGVISGTGGVTKNGAGTWTLSGPGANTYSGGTILNAGTLALAKTAGVNALAGNVTVGDGSSAAVLRLDAANQIADAAVVMVSASGLFNLNNANETVGGISGASGGQIALGSGTLTVGNAGAAAFAGGISGTGSLVKQGAGTQTLGGASTYTGNTTINAGTLALDAGGSIAGSPIITLTNGATLDVSAASFTLGAGQTLVRNASSGVAYVTGDLTLAAGAQISLQANGSGTVGSIIVTGDLTANGNTLSVNVNGASLGAGTYPLITCGGTITGSFNATPVITGAGITSGYSVEIQQTAGQVNLRVYFVYTGTGRVWSGGGADNNWSTGLNWGGSAPVSGDDLVFSGITRQTNVNNLSGLTAATVSFIDGGFSISGNGLTVVGGLTNKAGNNAISAGLTMGGPAVMQMDAGTLTVGAVAIGANSLTVGGVGNVIAGGVISGNGQLVKQGSGTLTLSAANTFSGKTTINAGTLAIGTGGSLASSTNITIGTGTTLNVSAVSFTLGASQTLARNATTGVGTISGNVTLASGAKVSLQGNNGFGTLHVAGNLTLNGNVITINFSGGSLAIGTYPLITYTGTKTGSFNVTPTIVGSGIGVGLLGRIVESAGVISLKVYAAAHGVSAANFKVVENDLLNNSSSQTVTATMSINGLNVTTVNRGDYSVQVGTSPLDDMTNGVIITSVANNGRDHGEDSGVNYCTSGSVASSAGCYIPISTTKTGAEYNIDVSAAFLPYAKFRGGYARNSAGTAGGANNLLTASSGLVLGTHFVDNGGGVSTVNLTSLGIHSQTDGVLLVNGGENNNKYANSVANADGTWTIFCRSNNADGQAKAQGAVAFAFIPKTNAAVISGKFAGNGSIVLFSGATPRFSVTNTAVGTWQLSIPGHAPSKGVLVISPEGTGVNFDNIISAQPSGNNWIIQSRDIPSTPAQTPGLQTPVGPAVSFVFIPGPAATLVQPFDGNSSITTVPTLKVTPTHSGAGNLTVKFYGRELPRPGPGRDFCIPALPDTQDYARGYDAKMPPSSKPVKEMMFSQTDWIVANRVSKNIPYVATLGDCVHTATSHTQWKNATNAYYRLEKQSTTGLLDGIPYGITVGNHDQDKSGSHTGPTVYYNKYFGTAHFAGRSYYGGHYSSNNDNWFQFFSAGGMDFIVFSFEYDRVTDGLFDWANAVIATNQTRRIIVLSHSLLNDVPQSKNHNTTRASWDKKQNGKRTYEKLRHNPNLFLMLCGHVYNDGGEGRRWETYNGKTTQILCSDYQGRMHGGNGLMRLMYFSPSNNLVSVKTYSPWANSYETDSSSQFSFSYNMQPNGAGSAGTAYALKSTVTNVVSGTPTSFIWSGLTANRPYAWYVTVTDENGDYSTSPEWKFKTVSGYSGLMALPADANKNGIPDNWEAAHGLSDASADADGDGQNNYAEYISGTNPNDLTSVFKIINATSLEGQFTLTWTSVGGVRYRVQRTEALGNEFVDVPREEADEVDSHAVGQPSVQSFTEFLDRDQPRFYRVKVER